ncbi:MAG: DUF1501 domain-containing protein [Planctomycetota bacterium]|jgi:uncharacterized protein (DUF1501 family)
MSRKITRRDLLERGLWGFSLAATAPHFLGLSSRAYAGDEPGNDRILVVLQLSGGNDGLSTVVPYADPAYRKNRRSTAITDKEVLKLEDGIGLHPELKRTEALFKEGHIAIVQGASYPNPNRSHFKSMDVWHTGDLGGRARDTGWLGRAIDACCPEETSPDLTVNIGKSIPYALEARIHKPVSFENPERYKWSGNPRDKQDFEKLNEDCESTDRIRWLHRVALDARASSEKIRAAARSHRPKTQYPRGQLAADLRTVAALIAAGLDTRIYYVSLGGFDTHNNQKNRHSNLMRQLDPALGAFFADLSAGTDHGVAGPMFLVSDRVKGGLHGTHPSLTDLDRGDLKMRTDFRSVYATVLDDWLKVDSSRVLGTRFKKLPLL